MNDDKMLAMIEAPELKQVEKTKAEMIRSTFVPMAEMLDKFEKSYSDIVAEYDNGATADLITRAKRLRLDIAKVRIATEKSRKEQKAEYLRAGQAIDGVSNLLKWAVTEKENRLKDIEQHFEKMEKDRLEKLQSEREDLLSKFIGDASERDLSSMDNDVWDAYLSTKKKEYDDRVAAEKQAEIDRITREAAEAAERARIRAENERLKAEAVEREKQATAERAERERLARVEAEKRAKQEEQRKRAEADAQRKRDEESRKQREEYEQKLAIERAEREAQERAELAERKKREQLEAQLEKEKAERERLEAEKERERIAEEKRLADKKQRERNRLDLLHTLNDMDKKNELTPSLILDAIMSGGLPHVRYEG